MNEFDQERLDFERQHKTTEKQVLPYFRKALADMIAPVIAWVNQNGITSVPYEILIKRDVWRKAYQDVYQLIGMKFARREFYRQRNLDRAEENKASSIDFLIDVWSARLRDYALNYIYLIENELNDTTLRFIQEALTEAYELGVDEQGRLRLFEKTLNSKMRTRSATISRTESTTISNLGKEIGARSWISESGQQGYHVWLGRVVGERATHLEANDTILPLDQDFIVGGEPAARPGDVRLSSKERINCRCTQSIMSATRYNAYVKRGRIVDGKLIGAS